MSHPPSSHDPHLPSALSSLFSTEGDHFLPAPTDASDILIPSLTDGTQQHQSAEDAQQHGADSGATPQHQDDHMGLPLLYPDDSVQDKGSVEAVDPAESEAGSLGKRDDARGKARLTRKMDPTALEVASNSLRAENERLHRIISSLEGTGDDSVQHTLRELASAAVNDASLASFSFESLQQHLDQQEQVDPARPNVLLDHPETAMVSEATASDFLSGLVTQVTDATPATVRITPADPFRITRLALEADIASTREAISAKEAEVAAFRSGTATPIFSPPDRATLEAQISRTTAAIESSKRKASVLRDMTARLQRNLETLTADVAAYKAELDALALEEAEDEDRGAEPARAVGEVRAYIEAVIKTWHEKGTLPSAPIAPLPLLLRDGASNLAPPPSSLPKKRGRPARAAPKPSVVPAALAHLVPDPETVRAREQDMPIRRKGVKRNKVELEREKMREEEEGEMLRNLVGMGVWGREVDEELD